MSTSGNMRSSLSSCRVDPSTEVRGSVYSRSMRARFQAARLSSSMRRGDQPAAALPEAARRYLRRIEEILETPVDIVSTGPGREAVFYSCNGCHSLMLVTQQGMSRDRWDETLEWMVEEQGMNEIQDTTTRDLILDYLARHFGSG